jgi:hypothetical protein
METSKYNLNHKQEKAIMALLIEPNLKQAAETIGIGETTLWRWMQDAEFEKAFRDARRRALSQTISRLQQSTTQAVDTLTAIMVNDENPASSRVTAAKTVLEMAFKAYEVEDLAVKVEEMEEYIEENMAFNQ